MPQHMTVGTEESRCTGGPRETKSTVWDWVMEVAVSGRTV
jgi:hypothetical protein